MAECGHCDGELRGFARAQWKDVCHPDTGLDCYRLVTVYGHETPCFACADVRILEDQERRERMWGKPLPISGPQITNTQMTEFLDG